MSRCGVLIQQSDARMNGDKQRYNEQQEHNTDIYTIRVTSQSSLSDGLSESTGVDARLRVRRQWPEIT